MEIVYRKLQPADARSYRALRLASLQSSPDNFGSTYGEESKKTTLFFEALIEKGSLDCFMFGAFDEGRLIGITGFIRFASSKIRHRGEIVQVYVDPAYRGQKVGEHLLRGAVENAFQLEGVEQIELDVIADNGPAIRLYQKVGFEAIGVQRKYFKDGERYWDQQFMQLFKEKYLAPQL
jgi:RimJ/RimL family protein N-acetyltransferase